ncbi:MAG: septal ring lytic transglycosylase RlpA family protein [Candidatus Kapabacteria bacterium]|nr:septal ring lytic transglycosylase RlpA family protein [Candidatus Kapabacteria bacterium]
MYSFGVQAKIRTFFIGNAVSTSDAIAAATSALVQHGVASWYGPRFHGRRTANGEIYDMHDFTAAHLTLPLGTVIRVTNTENNKTTLVRVNDRGPYIEGRILDLSYSAAKAIGILGNGTGDVKVEVVEGIRLGDTTVATDFLSSNYEFAAIKDLLTTTAFAHDMKPLVVDAGTFSIIHETDNFAEALKTWQTLRKKHGDIVYLVPQRKPDEQIAFEEWQHKTDKTLKKAVHADKRSLKRGKNGKAAEERSRLYNYQLLLLELDNPLELAAN